MIERLAPQEVVVFLGPSLSRAEAERVLPANYQPPARRGDFYRYLTSRVRAFILIDGVFHNSPAVWHAEILEVLHEGARVIGASSMGALRAAELHTLGMEGVGQVFEWYRDGVLDGDDEVALLHGPEESGYRALSDPLVNLRKTVGAAVEAGCVPQVLADALIAELKGLHYPKRSYPRLLQSESLAAAPPEVSSALRRFVETQRVDLKKSDALLALSSFAASGLPREAGGAPAPWVKASFNEARTWERPLPASLGLLPGQRPSERMDAAQLAAWKERLFANWFIRDWASLRGVSCPPADRESFIARWRTSSAVESPAEWLSSRGLTRSDWLEALDDRALCHWVRSQGAHRWGLGMGSSDDPFLTDWARARGVSKDGEEAAAWLLREGPRHFGFTFDLERALLREIQLGELTLSGAHP